MIYSFDGRVRYSETGENGLLTLPGILNYFQDCSTFQSEDSNAVSVPVKSYTLGALTVNQLTAVTCALLLVIVLPVVLLVTGIVIWLRRRKR